MHWSGVTTVLLLLLPCWVFGIALRDPLIDTDVIIGDTVTLSGTVTDNPGKLPISWRRQETREVITLGGFIFSTQLYIRQRYKIEVFGETYNLIISNVELGDEGTFEIGYISSSTFIPLSSTSLRVLIPPDAGFPVCDVNPAAVEYLVGETLTLNCQTKGGKPKPGIVWLRNGVEVARTSTNETLTHDITLQQSDNGALFECQLDGSAVTETLSCERRPNVATPIVNLGPSVVTVDEGRDAIFNCIDQGVFSPKYEWSFPTHILQSGRYNIENKDSRLIIHQTTMQDINAIVRCELRSAGRIVAGRSATLLIRPKPTTDTPTTIAPTTTPTTMAPTTTSPTTQPPIKVVITTEAQLTTSVAKTTTELTTPQNTAKQPTTLAIRKTQSEPYTSSKTDWSQFTTQHMTEPNKMFITTPLTEEKWRTSETTIIPVDQTNRGIPKQKSDRRKNSQHLGLIFAAATAMIIVLTIVVFAAFCLVVCKAREKKDSFNVSNNASSLAGSTGPPYNNGIFRNTSEYHDDYELTDNISQRESQASATESATGITISTPQEGLYTMPAKLGKTAKICHPASSSQPDFSTFRLVDESLRNNKALASNSLGRRPRPVPAPKPPKSYGEYENVKRQIPNSNGYVQPNTVDIDVLDTYENTPLRSAPSPDPIQTNAIYENRSDIREAALLDATPLAIPKQPSPVVYTKLLDTTSPTGQTPKQSSPVVYAALLDKTSEVSPKQSSHEVSPRDTALLDTMSPISPKQPSAVVSPESTTGDYSYEDVMKIADSFLHDLEQLS